MASVLITGGHKGLGLEAARHVVASGGTDLVLAGRNLPEVEQVAAALRAHPGTVVRAIELDVSSLGSVRAAAGAYKAMIADGEVGRPRALLLNAGAQFMAAPQYSVDGFEMTFATNCLGHFLLLNLLIDELEPDGRVVWTASGTHDPATMDGRMVGRAADADADALANDGKAGKPLSGGVRYSTSKLCDILYSYELDRRLRASGRAVSSIAYDPGFVPETALTRSAPGFAQRLMRTRLAKRLFRALGVTPGDLAFSGKGLGRMAIDPAFRTASGKYIQSSDGRLRETKSSEASYDAPRARRLWSDSTRLVGLQAGEIPAALR